MHKPHHEELDSELVIGLAAALGTEVKPVVEILTERLQAAGYQVHPIKVAKEIIPRVQDVPKAENWYSQSKAYMVAGNEARRRYSDDAILAKGVAACIYGMREQERGLPAPNLRTAYIIDSLKRPEEVHELRQIYPGGFVLIGVHSEESRRKQNLIEERGMTDSEAAELIELDGEEKQVKHGQRLNRTFHLADFFVRESQDRQRLYFDIKRIVEIWFGNPYVTPTFDEYAMFMAFSAALRSADLSRQVGAVVAKNKSILSTGANDCPAYGGGLYWPERNEELEICDLPGGRDYMRKVDSNRMEQRKIIDDILSNLEVTGLAKEKARQVLEASRLTELTEYGRVVHAEMEAILACARNAISTQDATLYCTTFPCHNCAKHIVASGITRVVYVEPYPKSKALEFHTDSITTNPDDQDASGHISSCANPDCCESEISNSNESKGISSKSQKVKFVPFVGIGPRRFFDLFSMNGGTGYPLVRKTRDEGEIVPWRLDQSKLRLKMLPGSYLNFEMAAAASFGSSMKEKSR